MPKLRKRALFVKLEEKGCLRISFLGLKEKFPIAFSIVELSMKEFEMYEPLETMINKVQQIDDTFAIFLVPGGKDFIIINNQDYYNETEYKTISQKTGIPIEEFNGLLHLT